MNRLGKIVTEGYDPYGQPQPQKSSTLGKVAKWGGLGALALGGLGLANPEMVGNITGSDTLQNAFQSGHDKIANAYDWFSGGKLSGNPAGAADAAAPSGGNTPPAAENPAANNATSQPTANQTQPVATPAQNNTQPTQTTQQPAQPTNSQVSTATSNASQSTPAGNNSTTPASNNTAAQPSNSKLNPGVPSQSTSINNTPGGGIHGNAEQIAAGAGMRFLGKTGSNVIKNVASNANDVAGVVKNLGSNK